MKSEDSIDPRRYNHPMKLSPMLATLAEPPLKQKGLVYEPKYDGIRALVEVAPAAKGAVVHIWSRNGNEKTAQFPAIARALEAAGRKLKAPLVLDGEIVALDERGRPAGFQRLQGRMHLKGALDVSGRRGPAGGVHRLRHPARGQGRSHAPSADRAPRASRKGSSAV